MVLELPNVAGKPAIINSVLGVAIGATKSPPILFNPRTRSSNRKLVTRPLITLTFTTKRSAPGNNESIRISRSVSALTVMLRGSLGPLSE